MSIEAVSWALKVPLGGNAKVVLIGLANHARADGFDEARPAVATLAKYASCDHRTVQRHIRKLEADGWIEQTGWHAVNGRGDRRVAVWRLLAGRQNAVPSDDGVTVATDRGDSAVADGVTPAPPEPSLEPSGKPSGENAGASDVAEVWAHYQQVIPNGGRYDLNHARRLLIGKALKVRSVEECCRAIDGLAASDYHVGNGYLDIKYALLGGGRNPSIEATVDRLGAQLANGTAGGNGKVTSGITHGGDFDRFKDVYEN